MKPDTTTRDGQGIDWSAIHHRVEVAGDALAQGATLSAQESRAILRARARLLAQEHGQMGPAVDLLEVVEFSLASETYGFDAAFVREVYPLKEFTPIPGVPPFVLGIVNVRGQILSIIDLKKFFELPEKGLGQLNKLIILRSEQMELCILADDILGARSIELQALQAAPSTVSGIGAQYLRGITAERVIILDAAKLLNDDHIVVHQESD
ncbi:MAG: chemotaxis protein CheW [Anaerolineales bacterium]